MYNDKGQIQQEFAREAYHASDKSPSVNLTETATIGEEDHDAEDPDDTKLSGGPETANAIREQESKTSTSDGADLNHGRHVALDVGECYLVELIDTKQFLEVALVECT